MTNKIAINSNNEDKYKIEHDYIVRYLVQKGFTVDEEKLFETIVGVIETYEALKQSEKYLRQS